MFQLSESDRNLLTELNAKFSLRWHANKSQHAADITDIATGKHYATGCGDSEQAAAAEALKVAASSPKPLTPAQARDAALGVQSSTIAEHEQTIKDQNKELAALRKKLKAQEKGEEAADTEKIDKAGGDKPKDASPPAPKPDPKK